jgi:hypothetical protein
MFFKNLNNNEEFIKFYMISCFLKNKLINVENIILNKNELLYFEKSKN